MTSSYNDHITCSVLFLFAFPLLLQASAMCVILVAQQNPVAFYRQGETLVKPLLKGMTHQHSKVRVESLKVRGTGKVGCFMQRQVWMRVH